MIWSNRDAQLRCLMMIELGTDAAKLVSVLNYDGMPITADNIYRQIKDHCQNRVEGFVIHYVLSSVSDDGKTLVFDSESIENIAPGWRSRETWKIISDNQFTETFDHTAPGKEFTTYVENRFKRKK